jgi:hypothetical protein
MIIADRENHAVKMLRLSDLSYIGNDLRVKGIQIGEISWPKTVDMNAESIVVGDSTDLGIGRVQVFKRIIH